MTGNLGVGGGFLDRRYQHSTVSHKEHLSVMTLLRPSGYGG
jgi:hypothetical protein